MTSLVAIVAAFGLAVPGPPGAVAFPGFGIVLPQVQHQVHIEQRVVIRLVPTSPATRRQLLEPPHGEEPVRYKEKKLGHCVRLDNIAGIAPQESRLLLFMRDHRLLSLSLERICDPAAFYLGAYVDRNADGRLCSGRDTLRARTGASCEISRINRLVAIKD
jgi:hypothetical protein